MNTILQKGNIIAKIRKGEDLDQIINYVQSEIYKNGPNNSVVLEVISYIKLFQPEYFRKYEQNIIETMGLFFKHPKIESLTGSIFEMYHNQLKDELGNDYTPMQADILKKIKELQYFSFSAPTSTGKSFVFRNLISAYSNDVVVIVPSRALINEYYTRLSNIVNRKKVNILTFVDKINTKHSNRNIFILTPERAKDLFKNKDWLKIDLILFDEAQLSDENSVRGLYFDSIVRRALKYFPNAKFVFAHPFVENPEAQLQKNDIKIIDTTSAYNNYELKNVGQIFYTHDTTNQKFYHFGSDPKILGRHKLESTFDPIEAALQKGGSVLIYVSKTHIYSKQIYSQFQKYISMCHPIDDSIALNMIENLKDYIGASTTEKFFYSSDMLEKLKCGIVVHHGSMPLTARLILEHFTQRGFCRICFATSTLEQGINMPFDVVYLNRLEESKTLSVKNLIGRAGRSTNKPVFDYGSVILRPNAMSRFRNVCRKKNTLSPESRLDTTDDTMDKKYEEYKEAIKTGEFSDEYNLTNKDLEKLKSDSVTTIVPTLLDMMFTDTGFVLPNAVAKEVYEDFQCLYKQYLGRELTAAEKYIFDSAIKIMIWKVHGKTFSKICQERYAYVSKAAQRRLLSQKGLKETADNLTVRYIAGYNDIPDKNLRAFPLFPSETKGKDVDYDRIVYDTYDFLDKLIGFKLSDLFYAIFHQYSIEYQDNRAERLAKLIKYGTEDLTEIWMLRYGFSFEEIEWLSECVETIDEREIAFNEKINDLDEDKLASIEQYIYSDKS
ncbi:DEAD/DEAH box helicase [Anaerostipes sp.]|uniref:DEAD/DEAH box helicase n=1 Tax=Anaerostipes sp. TaxID=1872530 RepID=UPI0025BFE0EA|nr:DEAD/DEAH box helicase [Anaerostipes sp.]MBS7008783.1 DEAD/DEAH box helicase [Anaerostipes sp.]